MKLVRAPQPPPLPPVPAPERARYGTRGSPSRTEPAADSLTAWSSGQPTVNGSVVVYGRVVEVRRGATAAAAAKSATATTTISNGNTTSSSNGNTSSCSDARYDLKWEDGLLQYNVGLPYIRDALIVQDFSSLGSGAVLDDKVLQLY
jgi:hypothetical protein